MKLQTIRKILLILAAATFAFWAWKSSAQDATTPQLPYGVTEVLKLEQAKVSDGTIIAYISNSGNRYVLNASQIIYLRDQGVSDAVLTALLMQPQSNAAYGVAQPATPAPMAQQPVSAPAPTVVAPQPSVTYVQPAPTYYYPYNYYPYSYYYAPPVSISLGWGWGWGWRGGWGWHGGWGGGWHGGWHH